MAVGGTAVGGAVGVGVGVSVAGTGVGVRVGVLVGAGEISGAAVGVGEAAGLHAISHETARRMIARTNLFIAGSLVYGAEDLFNGTGCDCTTGWGKAQDPVAGLPLR